MVTQSQIFILALIFIALTAVACNPIQTSVISSCENRTSVLYSSPIESYCSTPKTVANPITITGSAFYNARIFDTSLHSPSEGLTGVSHNLPIRYAELRVKNSFGDIIQCGETDGSGNYSVKIPQASSTYTLEVNSRANNDQYKAYILKCPEQNTHYSLTTSFKADAAQTLSDLVATVKGEVLGGAFNMLDQILKANEFLRSEVETCPFTECTDFDVAPLVNIYWEKGFDPSEYGASSGSFFIPSTNNRIFIIGGILGNTDNSDTDHFDNSVVLHEYAHFLEHKYSISDSPGGAHSLSGPIDPRLAWSEGFANFFQAAVQNINAYIDTAGNNDGLTGDFVRLNLEEHIGSYESNYVVDVPNYSGEGNFRELSISRLLYDAFDSDDDSEDITNGFPELWAAMTNTTGLSNTNQAFRTIGVVHNTQSTLSNGTDWSPILSTEKHVGSRREYAYYIEPNDLCTGDDEDTGLFNMDPEPVANEDGGKFLSCNFTSFPYSECFFLDPTNPSFGYASHLVLNNDFFHYKHSGGSLTVQLDYITESGFESNLNLFIYSGNARYGYISDMENNILRKEGLTVPDYNIATNEIESFSKNLPAGDYLINVKANNQANEIGDSTDYQLFIGGTRACPASL